MTFQQEEIAACMADLVEIGKGVVVVDDMRSFFQDLVSAYDLREEVEAPDTCQGWMVLLEQAGLRAEFISAWPGPVVIHQA